VGQAGDSEPVVARGTWAGWLVPEPRGHNGFGYDPVFFVPTHGCTSAELDPDIKNRISHRGQALAALLQRLREVFRVQARAPGTRTGARR
jgi:XTP/dITP diphosphohydrolase